MGFWTRVRLPSTPLKREVPNPTKSHLRSSETSQLVPFNEKSRKFKDFLVKSRVCGFFMNPKRFMAGISSGYID